MCKTSTNICFTTICINEEIYKKWIKKTGASAGKQYTFSTQHNNSPSAPGVSPIFSGVSPAQVSAVKKLCIHLP